jgi:hypothetical protein
MCSHSVVYLAAVNMAQQAEFDTRFQHPFTMTVCGATQSGKTHFTKQLLEKSESLINPPPEKIIWCYGEYQPLYETIKSKPKIEFVEGFPEGLYDSIKPDQTNLLVIDDLMSELVDNKQLSKLFTRGSHHRNLSIIFLVQNLFPKGSQSRTISLNTHYIILFKNPRDKAQMSVLGRQMYPGHCKYFEEAFHDATKKPYGYICVDSKQQTPDELRLRSCVVGEELYPYAYLPK